MSDKDFNPGLSFCKVMRPFAASIGEMSARNMFSFELSDINHCAATSDEDDRKAMNDNVVPLTIFSLALLGAASCARGPSEVRAAPSGRGRCLRLGEQY